MKPILKWTGLICLLLLNQMTSYSLAGECSQTYSPNGGYFELCLTKILDNGAWFDINYYAYHTETAMLDGSIKTLYM